MPLSDGLAEAVREGVQHAVVGVHRGQAVLIQLVSHDAHQLLHTIIIVCPVTHNLGRGEDCCLSGEVRVGVRSFVRQSDVEHLGNVNQRAVT